MKNKLKQLISALLVILMIVSIFTACKKEQESDTIDDVEETTEAPAIEAEKQFTPSNTFYSKNTSKNTNDEEYKIEIVDDKVYFTERDGGNYTNILEASGTYTIDENGNYILDLCRMDLFLEYFGKYTIPYLNERDCFPYPIVMYKLSESLYFIDEFYTPVVRLGATDEKYIWLGQYGGEYDFVIEQNSEINTDSDLDAYLIDGENGTYEWIEIQASDVTWPDVSKVGECTMTAKYQENTYELNGYVYAEGTEYEFPKVNGGKEYGRLRMRDEAELPLYVLKGTTAEQYFANYTGTESLFYFKDSENVEHAVTEYTVDFWDTSVDSREMMCYRVNATVDNVTYMYCEYVHVLDEADVSKGYMRMPWVDDDNVEEADGYYGLWYVPKGNTLDKITGSYYLYNGEKLSDIKLTVSGYDPNKLGSQLVDVYYGDDPKGVKIVVYVYDQSNAPIDTVNLEGLKLSGDTVDYSNAKLIVEYHGGAQKEESVDKYIDLIHVTYFDTRVVVSFEYKYTLEGVEQEIYVRADIDK